MNTDIKYIKENFIESRELCEVLRISQQELEKLIEEQLMPNSSYEISVSYKINSSLGDEKLITEIEKYYSKSIINLIQKNKNLNSPSEFKESLKAEFTSTYINSNNNMYGYDNIIEENGKINIQKLSVVFEQEWQCYLKGIYGICTLNATGAEIAKKEIVVKRLIDFNKKHGDKKLSDNDREILNELNTEFNEVSNLFAPYQRKNSSRGKYLDSLLELNSLSELIKNYS